jgi:hypothetical protein
MEVSGNRRCLNYEGDPLFYAKQSFCTFYREFNLQFDSHNASQFAAPTSLAVDLGPCSNDPSSSTAAYYSAAEANRHLALQRG